MRLLALLATLPLAVAHPQRVASDLAIRAYVDSVATAALRTGPVASLSILVARGPRIIVEKAYGKSDVENDVRATPATVYKIGSITKHFTGAAVMRLVEQGKLQLDDDVRSWLPTFPFGARRVTLRQLITHTSGIRNLDEAPGVGGAYVLSRLPIPNDSMIALVANDRPFAFEPGTSWRYSNVGYLMVGAIVAKASGMPLLEYLETEFFKPLRLTHVTSCAPKPLLPHRAQGYTVNGGQLVNDDYADDTIFSPAGGLCATARDLFTWSRALATGRVVNATSFAEMRTDAKLGNGTSAGVNYGFGFDVSPFYGHPAARADGGVRGFRTKLSLYPDDSVIVVALSNTIEARNSNSPVSALEVAVSRFALGVPDVGAAVARVASRRDAAAVIGEYQQLRARYASSVFDMWALNNAAYTYLRGKRVADALALFEFNATQFPYDPNVYDGLGDGYLQKGDTARAIAAYRRVRAMDARKQHAKEMLIKLGVNDAP